VTAGAGADQRAGTGTPVRFRHRVEHAAVAGLAAVIRRLPQSMALAVGSGIGRLVYLIDGRHRRITAENLAAVFPERSPQERTRIARAVFRHFGRKLMEVFRFSGMTRDEMLAAVEFVGDEQTHAAYAKGCGVIFITGHFGFWELHALVHAWRYPPISMVARALDNPLLDTMLTEIRGRSGNAVIDRRGGLRRILRTLNANQGIAILIDQHILGTDAVKVDFLGRPAATTSAVAAFALKTGAPILPVFALPLDDGRYRLIYEPPIPMPDPESPDAVRELTQRCSRMLEKYVRAHPELWLWMHRRWREDVPTSDAPVLRIEGLASEGDP
jgi:Kdo2-lipid IVA lauroyltransferase/acyltransferase